MLRCALPYKLAEHRYPGIVDEKTACEVGAYVWMQEKCPDIPIPRLHGFGFSDYRRVRPRSSFLCSFLLSCNDSPSRGSLLLPVAPVALIYLPTDTLVDT
jgi:hypothetical protein